MSEGWWIVPVSPFSIVSDFFGDLSAGVVEMTMEDSTMRLGDSS